ncbi:MAG: flavin-dependent dehydrogenase [Salibacteraceae bacterium]|jgi:flavin-dependent dehydrogenase
MSDHKIESDILIIGGGIAGCIAAIALSDYYSVVVIDKESEAKARIGECLAPAARRILKELGLDKEHNASNEHLINIGTKSYWGSGQLQVVDHLNNPDGNGWYLNRKSFESNLRKSAQSRGVECIWPAQFQSSEFVNSKWDTTAKLDVKAPDSITYKINSKFVIDASGRQSHFARKQGVERIHLDKLVSCWATMPNYNENRMSIISPIKDGWWYSSPLPGNRLLLALQTDSDLIERGMNKDVSLFKEQIRLNPEMHKFIEGHESELELHGIVSANSSRLTTVSGNQWVALGDAALSFDPLSSQGMFNAMASAMQLSKVMLHSNVVQNIDEFKTEQFHNMYGEQINSIWERYLTHKKTYYSQELRWENSEFWKRRNS